ncbi:MAG: hypothetical protein ACREIQ_01840 [Nitrospiria bacterium]
MNKDNAVMVRRSRHPLTETLFEQIMRLNSYEKVKEAISAALWKAAGLPEVRDAHVVPEDHGPLFNQVTGEEPL